MTEQSKNKFNIKNGVLIGYCGSDREVIIPSSVKAVAPFAFYGCRDVEKVETPVALASIGKGAFIGCKNLKRVIMPGRLYKRVAADSLFDDENAVYFRFYANSEGEAYFDDEKDASDANDEGLEDQTPEENAVADGNGPSEVKDDVQPVEIIDRAAAVGELEINEYDGGDIADYSVGESDFDDGRSLEDKIESIVPVEEIRDFEPEVEKHAYNDYEDFIIEDSTVVKYVGKSKTVSVPPFITVIGENAFSNSGVESVSLPAGVIKIGAAAFTWCESLKNINFPEGLQIIDDMAFADCGKLEEALLPESLAYIGASAFHACGALARLHLPAKLKTLSRRAFDFCVGLQEARIPESITALSDGVFSHCEALQKVVLPAGCESIGNWAFAECYELRDIAFPESLKKIGDVAFMNCRSLKRLSLPQSLVTLGRQSFVGCEGLTAVFLPVRFENSVKSNKVFQGLKTIQIHFVDLV